jgi:long-chain-fatty-acid--CoA ligase ACSBG
MGQAESKKLEAAPKFNPDLVPIYPTEAKAGSFWTADGKDEKPVIYAKDGPASEKGAKTTTIPAMFRMAKSRFGNRPALRVERPVPAILENGKAPPAIPRESWQTWSFDKYYQDSARGAKALISLGFQQHDAVNVFGFNSPEWMIAQNACVMAGGKVAGIYPTDTPEQVTFKSKHSGALALVVEGFAKVEAMSRSLEDLPKLRVFVVWGLKEGEEPKKEKFCRKDGSEVRVLSWEAFLKLGDAVEEKVLEERDALIKPTHCFALIYTSGTTGNPKAVMLSHDNMGFEGSSILSCFPHLAGTEGKPERAISYLPLSHVAGMLLDIIAPIFLTSIRPTWFETYFARPYDLKIGSLGDRLRCVKPTIFLGVPRVWEKVSETMKAAGAKVEGLQKKVAVWAKGKGLEFAKNCQVGGSGVYPSSYSRAESLVLSKVKRALGLDECMLGLTGAAPIGVDTLEYFGSLGIQINEIYGMSESTGATTISTDKTHLWGSCGFAMAGTEVKCFIVDPTDINKKTPCPPCPDIFKPDEAHQGELCFRGRHVMMGYLANPDLGEAHVQEIRKKNAESIDDDGWLHSGDKGCQGSNGMFRITGRYKELIIGSGGENIAPVPIEDNVKKVAEAISNIMMIGDKRKFNVAFVTLKAKGATGELPGSDELVGPALRVSPGTTTISGAMKDPVWHKYITDAIVATNKLNPPPSHIQRFTILPKDFSVATNEMTPTLKLKRGVVEKMWPKTIESLYNEDADKKQAYFPCDQGEAGANASSDEKQPEAEVHAEQPFSVGETNVSPEQIEELRRERTVTTTALLEGDKMDVEAANKLHENVEEASTEGKA